MNSSKLKRRDILRLFVGLSVATLSSTTSPTSASDGCVPTGTDDKGPYHIPGAPPRTLLAGPEEPGERLVIRGRVLGGDCRTVPSALLDVWQADASGSYHDGKENYRLRGQIKSSKLGGAYEITTVRPGGYKVEGGFRPAHIHFIVTHPAFEPLTTQLYFAGDPYLAPDDAGGSNCHSDDLDRIIELTRVEKGEQTWVEGRFDVVLTPVKK